MARAENRPDDGPASQGGGQRGTKVSWVAVGIIIAASIGLGLSLILWSWVLAVVSAVVGVVGLVVGLRAGIMEDVH